MKVEKKDIGIIILSIIILLLLIAIIICGYKYHNAKCQIITQNDSIYVYKNKYNEEYLAKNTYILKADQLEQYNKELYNECKSLKDNPLVITKTELITKIDTVKSEIFNIVYDSIHIDNDSNINFKVVQWDWEAKDDPYYTINGTSGIIPNDSASPIFTNVNSVLIDTKLTLDVIDNGNQLSVIAKSDNPYVTLSDMQSVVIDPTTSPTIKNMFKPKRWGFGPTISGGLLFGVDFKGQPVVGAGGLIGFSIHYDLIQW